MLGRASPIPPRPAQTTTVVPTAVAKVEAVILSEESEENLPAD